MFSPPLAVWTWENMAAAAQFDHFHQDFLAAVQDRVLLCSDGKLNRFFLLTQGAVTHFSSGRHWVAGMGTGPPVPVEANMGNIDVLVDGRIHPVQLFCSKLSVVVLEVFSQRMADGRVASSCYCPRVILALSRRESSCLRSCKSGRPALRTVPACCANEPPTNPIGCFNNHPFSIRVFPAVFRLRSC